MTQASSPLKVLVLQGGPDREAPVSRESAKYVAKAITEAGHEVILEEMSPQHPEILDIPCDVIFPAMHGPFGEGGPLQRMMEERELCFVGCSSKAATSAINKATSKTLARKTGVPTPSAECIQGGQLSAMKAPCVVKPVDEGSSFGVTVCKDEHTLQKAIHDPAFKNRTLLIEQFIQGHELTVGVLDGQALAPIQIVPKAQFYDFEAKYQSDQTEYRFDTVLDEANESLIKFYAEQAFKAVEAQHLSRVDFLIDEHTNHLWFLEINTMPGFTDHSLLPKAAAQAGKSMPELCDYLLRLALRDRSDR